MQRLSVTKCQGTGNDFVLLDVRHHEARTYAPLAQFLCDRHFGVGADGLLVVSEPSDTNADVRMQIFNADGSEAEMCGNGVRCVARYLLARDPGCTQLRIETAAGVRETTATTTDDETIVHVGMGVPRLIEFPNIGLHKRISVGEREASSSIVSLGNPHVVVFVVQDPRTVDLAAVARDVEGWRLFATPPNVEVARVHGDSVFVRVCERGVGETYGCGTGACAVGVAAILARRATSPLTVTSRGGSVAIEWPGLGHSVTLTGPAEIIFEAEVLVPQTFSTAPSAV